MEATATKEKSTSKKTALGYTKKDSEQIVFALNKVLANYSVHYQKLRNYHWNVKGEDFFDLHEQFELQYNEAKVHIDELAERIRVFGMTPYSTMKEYLEYSDIQETGTDIEADEMVDQILEDYKILLHLLAEAVDIAGDMADSGTEEMAKKFIKKIEKHHWMLSAFAER